MLPITKTALTALLLACLAHSEPIAHTSPGITTTPDSTYRDHLPTGSWDQCNPHAWPTGVYTYKGKSFTHTGCPAIATGATTAAVTTGEAQKERRQGPPGGMPPVGFAPWDHGWPEKWSWPSGCPKKFPEAGKMPAWASAWAKECAKGGHQTGVGSNGTLPLTTAQTTQQRATSVQTGAEGTTTPAKHHTKGSG